MSGHCQPDAPALAGFMPALFDAGDGEHTAHPLGGEIGVAQEPRAIHQDELLGEVEDGARALESSDHSKVRLVAVEIRGEHDAGLVEAWRPAEGVARER